MHGQQENPDTWEAFGNFSRGAETIQNRHGDVQDDQIRAQLSGLFKSFLSVRGFAADFDAARFKDRADTRP